jgi:hypothetical protein
MGIKGLYERMQVSNAGGASPMPDGSTDKTKNQLNGCAGEPSFQGKGTKYPHWEDFYSGGKRGRPFTSQQKPRGWSLSKVIASCLGTLTLLGGVSIGIYCHKKNMGLSEFWEKWRPWGKKNNASGTGSGTTQKPNAIVTDFTSKAHRHPNEIVYKQGDTSCFITAGLGSALAQTQDEAEKGLRMLKVLCPNIENKTANLAGTDRQVTAGQLNTMRSGDAFTFKSNSEELDIIMAAYNEKHPPRGGGGIPMDALHNLFGTSVSLRDMTIEDLNRIQREGFTKDANTIDMLFGQPYTVQDATLEANMAQEKAEAERLYPGNQRDIDQHMHTLFPIIGKDDAGNYKLGQGHYDAIVKTDNGKYKVISPVSGSKTFENYQELSKHYSVEGAQITLPPKT